MIKSLIPKNNSDLFNSFSHHRSVIFASLEGQYPCELYVNNLDEPNFAVLFTQFGFHFIAGDSRAVSVQALQKIIFETYLSNASPDEMIFLCSDQQNEAFLEKVFEGYSQIRDVRYSYKFNADQFNEIDQAVSVTKNLLERLETRITMENDYNSTMSFPVCRLCINDQQVAICEGFMIGDGHVELNVNVDSSYRQKGYGKIVTSGLIRKLLELGLTPNYTCWSKNISSNRLAKSLGFEKSEEARAFIWVNS